MALGSAKNTDRRWIAQGRESGLLQRLVPPGSRACSVAGGGQAHRPEVLHHGGSTAVDRLSQTRPLPYSPGQLYHRLRAAVELLPVVQNLEALVTLEGPVRVERDGRMLKVDLPF